MKLSHIAVAVTYGTAVGALLVYVFRWGRTKQTYVSMVVYGLTQLSAILAVFWLHDTFLDLPRAGRERFVDWILLGLGIALLVAYMLSRRRRAE